MLPETDCQSGYSLDYLFNLLGADKLQELSAWMSGQTTALCDGTRYNHDTKEYEAGCHRPHGVVIYKWDVERFLAGLPIID